MKIGLDMMGGDFAPLEAVRGLQLLCKENLAAGATIICIGIEDKVKPLLESHNLSNLVQFVPAEQVIDYHDHPAKALKEKQKSSIAIGFHLLATGAIDAFISAGNTGAMLAGSMLALKPIDGIVRPTISSTYPLEDGGLGLLVDVGLNADCKPQQLEQFAMLGSLYARCVLGIQVPRVALLNVGEEESKGNLLAKEAFPKLKANTKINFVGNVEGRDVLEGKKANVIVCDGFVGNIILKLIESLHDITKKRNLHDDYFQRFNYEIYGGTPVLGVGKPVIVGHGISGARAFVNMILLAETMCKTNICGKIAVEFNTPQSDV